MKNPNITVVNTKLSVSEMTEMHVADLIGHAASAETYAPKYTAQVLYDLRQLTGYCSGTDLHEFFRKHVGDPSPSGKVVIGGLEVFPQKAFNLFADAQLCAKEMRAYGVNEEAVQVFLNERKPEMGLRKACYRDFVIETEKP